MQHLVVDINVLVNMQHLQKLVNMQQRLLAVNLQELHTSEYATGNIMHCIYMQLWFSYNYICTNAVLGNYEILY